MLILENIKSAFRSIWQNKIQSMLAILGVVIGVSSVITLIALGQGLKNDVSGLIQGFGTNVIITVSGKINQFGGSFAGSNPASFISGDILTLDDVAKISALPGIQAATPLSLVSGSVKYKDKVSTPTLSGTYPNVLQAFEVLRVGSGTMFAKKDAGNVIVLGSQAQTDLFGPENAVGKKVTVGTRELEVIGTLAKSKTSSLFGSQFDMISMIPFDTATELNKNQVKILRIVSKAASTTDVGTIKKTIHDTLLANHHGEEDFSVLTQDDLLGLFTKFLNVATTMVSAIAAISLLVGGIGIMNIMLVTVTERTREIGLRKALGATKLAILIQFMTESLVITWFGGLLGLVISFAIDDIIQSKTSLHPEISAQIILLAVGMSAIIGTIFGLWPALRAAAKDPIEALRYE